MLTKKTHEVLQEELQNNELLALGFSETEQAQPPSHKLEISAGLLDKTISTRVSINRSLSPPSVRIEAKGTVESVTVEHDRLSILLFYV